MPVEWVDWLDMKVTDLMPTDYWRQPVEDVQIAKALQQAVRRGEERADTEARQEREQARKKAERDAEAAERLKRLKERV